MYARLPGFHLSTGGREASEALGKALRSAPLAALCSSPLERAVETAEALARPRGLTVVRDDRLLEWSFWARWQGLPWSRVRERDPQLLEVYGRDPAAASPEHPLEAAGRAVLAWAEETEGRFAEGSVIGVTHEAPLLAALMLGSGRDLSGYHSLNLPHLGAVRLRPGPAEVVDLLQWARAC